MAKPENWDEMDLIDQKLWARQLMATQRGNYIIGQALAYAMHEMRKVPKQYRENSNIEDMEVIAILFEPWVSYTEEQINKSQSKNEGEIENV